MNDRYTVATWTTTGDTVRMTVDTRAEALDLFNRTVQPHLPDSPDASMSGSVTSPDGTVKDMLLRCNGCVAGIHDDDYIH